MQTGEEYTLMIFEELVLNKSRHFKFWAYLFDTFSIHLSNLKRDRLFILQIFIETTYTISLLYLEGNKIMSQNLEQALKSILKT